MNATTVSSTQPAWTGRRHFLYQFGTVAAVASAGAWADPLELTKTPAPNHFTRCSRNCRLSLKCGHK